MNASEFKVGDRVRTDTNETGVVVEVLNHGHVMIEVEKCSIETDPDLNPGDRVPISITHLRRYERTRLESVYRECQDCGHRHIFSLRTQFHDAIIVTFCAACGSARMVECDRPEFGFTHGGFLVTHSAELIYSGEDREKAMAVLAKQGDLETLAKDFLDEVITTASDLTEEFVEHNQIADEDGFYQAVADLVPRVRRFIENA